MSSLWSYCCSVSRVGNRCSIFLRTPLALSTDSRTDGWVTAITFKPGWDKPSPLPTSRCIARIDRTTTRVEVRINGLRRRLRDEPASHDRVHIFRDRIVCRSESAWYQKATSSMGRKLVDPLNPFTSVTTVTAIDRLSFDLDELFAFLAGVRDSGEGVPLLDWLVDHTTEFAPYVTSAGWLPKDEVAFAEVCQKREKERAAADAAPIDFSYLDYVEDHPRQLYDTNGNLYDEAEDRWR